MDLTNGYVPNVNYVFIERKQCFTVPKPLHISTSPPLTPVNKDNVVVVIPLDIYRGNRSSPIPFEHQCG